MVIKIGMVIHYQMNERIRELAERCTTSFVNMHCEWEDDFDQEKFAELIVRECAKFCEDKNSKLLGTMMKEHFGVIE